MAFESIGEIGDLNAPAGTRDWAVAMRRRMSVTLHDTEATVQKFRDLVVSYDKSRGYAALTNQLGKAFPSLEEFCSAPHPYGLELPPFVLKHIRDAESETKRLRVAFEEVGYKRPTPQEMAAKAVERRDDGKGLPENGEIGNEHKSSFDNIKPTIGGTSAKYLVDRLARDAENKKNRLPAKVQAHRADILSRLQAGEFKSVRAAAIEAGIVKPDTPLTLLMRAWKRASLGERGKFLLWTEETLDTVKGK